MVLQPKQALRDLLRPEAPDLGFQHSQPKHPAKINLPKRWLGSTEAGDPIATRGAVCER
jgi:hypothetical protein